MPTYSVLASSSGSISLSRSSLRAIELEVGNTPGRTIITFPYPVNNGKYYELPTFSLKVRGKDSTGSACEKSWEIFRFGIYNNDGSNIHYKARGLFVAGMAEKQTHSIGHFDPSYQVHSAASKETGAWRVKDSFLIHDGPDIPVTVTNPTVGELYASIGCLEVCGGPAGFDAFNDYLILLSGSKKARTDALIEIGKSKIMTIHYLPVKRPALKEYTP